MAQLEMIQVHAHRQRFDAEVGSACRRCPWILWPVGDSVKTKSGRRLQIGRMAYETYQFTGSGQTGDSWPKPREDGVELKLEVEPGTTASRERRRFAKVRTSLALLVSKETTS